jgi:3-hydroxyisobutyrate dehydrogenase-like beta-hydroxyacid dehydrogenase
MSESRVGLIGVGLLGSALAERMSGAGLVVSGFDRDWVYYDGRPRTSEQPRATVVKMSSANQLAAEHDAIVMCLPDSQVVKTVVEELGGSLRAGMLLIDATTGDPAMAEEIAMRLAERQIGYVDATIAGSSEQARRGEAVAIIGGSADDVQRAERVLASWTERRFHVGPVGSGARLKLVVNLALGLNRAVLAEALSLAKACGIDQAATLEVLKATPAYSSVMDTKGAKMISRDFSPQARLAQHLKDVQLIRDLAARHGASTPLSELHEAILEKAVDLGYGDADNSAVIAAFG